MTAKCEFLPLLYNFTNIPIYCMSDYKSIYTLPASGTDYLPPQRYLRCFLQQKHTLAYLLTEFEAIYGFIKDIHSDEYFILGPVSCVPYSRNTLRHMHEIFEIPANKQDTFDTYFQELPLRSLEDMLSYFVYFYYTVNGETTVPHDILDTTLQTDYHVSAHHTTLEYQDKELERNNNSYYIEKRMLSFVTRGDVQGLEKFSAPAEINGGIIADTVLRQLKNIFIVTTSLVSRAAIEGGLSTSIAFHLSDSYILQAEGLSTAGALAALTEQMISDYTKRVAETKFFQSSDPVLFEAIQFVRQSTNRHITVSDVADHVGLSKNYLSSYFKKEIGFELNAFIRRCKLEESKELLLYTEKTLAEISNYLCFSSQSHFQSLFKKQFGITPFQFRKNRK